MHCLKVRSNKVGVSPGHFERGMSEDLLQMKYGAATPEIVQRERMPEGVERSDRRVESQLPA